MLGARLGDRHGAWQVVAQGKSPAAHKAFAHAAKSLATTGLDLILDADLLARAKAEWREKTEGKPYQCPIPDHIGPKL
jgi:aminobenzoyl-glutamate utilization protein B